MAIPDSRIRYGDYVSVALPDGEVRGTILTNLGSSGYAMYKLRADIGSGYSSETRRTVDLDLNNNHAPVTLLFSAYVARGDK